MNRITPCLENGPPNTFDAVLLAAAEAALEAGALIKELYGKPHDIRHKGAIDLVTEADLASEKAIIARLSPRFPEFAILAEESSASFGSEPAGPAWVIDPLDGTTNFAHGFPYFGVSIALTLDGIPRLGVIYCPIQDELFCASRGKGAWLNGAPMRVSSVADLQHSLVATGFPYDVHGTINEVMTSLQRMLPRVQDLRRAGAAALDLAYVACGRLDGFWEMHLKPWDTAAGALLVEEAGGTMSNFQGHDFTPFSDQTVASNTLIHREFLDGLRGSLSRGK